MKHYITWLKAKLFPDKNQQDTEQMLRAALLLSASDKQGVCPEEQDLIDYIEDNFSSPRKAEVKSWIARDAATFKLFIEQQERLQAKNQQQLLRAALVLQAAPTGDAPPSEAEITDWIRGTLNQQSAARVKSWVARDAATFNLSVELQQVLQSEQQPKPTSSSKQATKPWFNWQQPTIYWGGGLATAMSVLLLIMNWVPTNGYDLESQLTQQYSALPNELRLSRKDLLWRAGNNSKGHPASILQQSFQAGLKQGLQYISTEGEHWQQLIAQLPNETRCDSEQCLLVKSLGQWSALLYAACQSPQALPTEFWQRQQHIAQQIVAQDNTINLAPEYQQPLKQLANTSGDCSAVMNLIKANKP